MGREVRPTAMNVLRYVEVRARAAHEEGRGYFCRTDGLMDDSGFFRLLISGCQDRKLSW
jgi:hypothetical protein